MPSSFDQAKGYGYWVSKMEITTGLIWWQPIINVYFLRTRTAYRNRSFWAVLWAIDQQLKS